MPYERRFPNGGPVSNEGAFSNRGPAPNTVPPPSGLFPIGQEEPGAVRRDGNVRPVMFQFQERPDESTYMDDPIFQDQSPSLPPSTTTAPKGFEAGYDAGFFIRPTKGNDVPFDMKINGRMDFRHNGMVSQNPALPSVNEFEIERGRLNFQGSFLDPKLTFFLQTNFETDIASNMNIKDFYVNYAFNKAFNVTLGQWKVAYSRSWLQSSARLRFADRSMATTFFRPDRTQGVWIVGEPVDDVHYIAMIGNGFNTFSQIPAEFDTHFAYAGTIFWDPRGDFGPGFSDLGYHETMVSRVGGSFFYANMTSPFETSQFRLNDTGQRITAAYPGPNGAAAGFQDYEYAVDYAMKWRGFSFFSEMYIRGLQGFRGSAVPVNKISNWGYDNEGSYFLIRDRLEVMARHSRVIGTGGSPSADEYACGFNWFFRGHNLKITFDSTYLNGCPANSSNPQLRAGDRGVLFRSQLQAAF